MFFDDEGLMKPCARFFQLVSVSNRQPLTNPLAGKGLIVGADADGDTAAVATPLAYVAERTVFLHHLGGGSVMPTRDPFPANVDPAFIPDSVL